MPKWVEKIKKYSPGEKSLKTPFVLNNLVKTIPKYLTQRKKLDMSLLVEQCLQDVHLIKKKINLIITKEKIVLKNYVKS